MTLSSSNTKRARIPELDGLRGFAILMVVSIHYFYDPGGKLPRWLHYLQSLFALGWTGVDLFFVLSGFLIGGILLDARISPSYFKTFYIRRFFRIVPIYYLWIVLFMLLVWVGGPYFRSHMAANLRPTINWGIWSHFLFLQNLWTISYSTLAVWWLGVTWSLAVEEQFYLVAPFLVRFLSGRRLIIFLSSAIFAALCCRILVRTLLPMSEGAIYRVTPFRADALSLGMLAAIFWRDPEFREWLPRNMNLLYGMFGVLLAGMAAMEIWFRSPNGALTETVGYTWIALFYLSLLVIVLADTGGLVARVARIGWLREWGRVSYCVYIIHAAVKYLCFSFLAHNSIHLTGWRNGAAGLLFVAITYGVAKLSWTFFEQPLLQRGHRCKY
jgi:peptidoglycan/LPS O-acetylase OafA/YrhL